MCSGVVPQQPPTIATPSSTTKRSSQAARSRGAKRIARLALDQLGQAGIRQDRDRPGPAAREIGDVLGHLLRAGGAVQADDRHVERADDGRGRADVGADQHGAGGLDRDLDHERQLAAGLAHRAPGAVDRGLGLERVLAGLAQDHVGAAGDQPGRLHGERVLERAIGDVAERGQAGAGPDRADHEARAAVARDLGDRLAGQLGAAAVDLERPIRELELAERDRRAAEGVGLDGIGAGLRDSRDGCRAITSGRARLSTSEQFSLPQKSASTDRSRAWIWVPMAPSNSSTRRCRVSRKSAIPTPERGDSGRAGQRRAHAEQPARRNR